MAFTNELLNKKLEQEVAALQQSRNRTVISVNKKTRSNSKLHNPALQSCSQSHWSTICRCSPAEERSSSPNTLLRLKVGAALPENESSWQIRGPNSAALKNTYSIWPVKNWSPSQSYGQQRHWWQRRWQVHLILINVNSNQVPHF